MEGHPCASHGKKDRKTGLPDLFVNRHDNERFFAEVKGTTEKISDEQEEKSKLLDEAAGKCVSCIINLEMTTDSMRGRHAPALTSVLVGPHARQQ